MEKLINEQVFGIGDLIRAMDFKPMPGRGDCYLEGVIYDVVNHPVHGARMFRVRVVKDVWDGNDITNEEHSRFAKRVYVPVQTSDDFDTRINFVSTEF